MGEGNAVVSEPVQTVVQRPPKRNQNEAREEGGDAQNEIENATLPGMSSALPLPSRNAA
jgi:hypothetical protein